MRVSLGVSQVAITAVVAAHFGRVLSLSVPFRRQMTNTSTEDPFNFKVVDFDGDGDIIYVANITLGGQLFEVQKFFVLISVFIFMDHPQVQLDTGSSDLWVNTQNVTLDYINDTNIHTEIEYG
jgi:hypothetical protein